MKTKNSIPQLLKKHPIILVFVLFTLAAPLLFTTGYIRRVLVEMFFFAALGSGFNILGGFARQTNWAAASFFSIGAFVSMILYLNFGISPWIGIFISMAVSGIMAFFLSPILRIRGVYFAIATISVCDIILQVWKNLDISGRANGLTIPDSTGIQDFWNMKFTSDLSFYFIVLIWMLIVVAIASFINRSRLGYYLRAVRDDEDAAISMGLNTHRYKAMAFVISAILMAGTGTFYAFKLTSVDPGLVATFDISLKIALCAIIGGIGTIWGPVIGAITVITLFEGASATFGTLGGGIGYLIYGLMMILVVIFRPAGLISLVAPIKNLFQKLFLPKKELMKP